MMTIYVGNLLFSVTENDLQTLFERYGTVHSVKLIKDRQTGRPRGFGFVEMDEDAGNAAVEELDGAEYGGRSLRVNEAKEKAQEQSSRRPQTNRRFR